MNETPKYKIGDTVYINDSDPGYLYIKICKIESITFDKRGFTYKIRILGHLTSYDIEEREIKTVSEVMEIVRKKLNLK